jgi:hypothetical protein
MRSARFGLLICLLLLSVSVWTQQTPSAQQPSTPSPAPKDAQAVSVLAQALTVAGGTTAIAAITDYTASGSATYPASQAANITGTVTIIGHGLNQFRVDEVLPTGSESQSVNNGGITVKMSDGTVQIVPYPAPVMAGSITLPCLQLAALSMDPNIRLIYKGIVNQAGVPLHDIRTFRVFPGQANLNGPFVDLGNAELYFDASTLQLVMAQDTARRGVVRTIQYSDYRTVKGVAVPFSVSEQINSGVVRQIQLNRISFNSGLQDSAFDLSQ